MTAIDVFSLVSSVASITLAIVAIYLAVMTERRAAESHQKTLEALQQIDRRAAVTESTVGAHFQQMMETVLTIVKTATAVKGNLNSRIETIRKTINSHTEAVCDWVA